MRRKDRQAMKEANENVRDAFTGANRAGSERAAGWVCAVRVTPTEDEAERYTLGSSYRTPIIKKPSCLALQTLFTISKHLT